MLISVSRQKVSSTGPNVSLSFGCLPSLAGKPETETNIPASEQTRQSHEGPPKLPAEINYLVHHLGRENWQQHLQEMISIVVK